jgi:hypothetical protein
VELFSGLCSDFLSKKGSAVPGIATAGDAGQGP